MRYRIGDIVKTNDGTGEVIHTLDNEYYVSIGDITLIYLESELTLVSSPKTDYWNGFDDGFCAQTNNPAFDYTNTVKMLGDCAKPAIYFEGFTDGADFANLVMDTDDFDLDDEYNLKDSYNEGYWAGFDDGYECGLSEKNKKPINKKNAKFGEGLI